MSEEWRTIPEFPKYEITSDGDVRNRNTKNKINEVENKTTGAYSYSLRRNDGTSTCRSFWGLVYSAYPELAPTKSVKVLSTRSYAKRGQWVDIPGYPTYQAHPDGLVRYKVSKKHRKVRHDKKTGDPYFLLYNEKSISSRLKVARILRMCFPEYVEQEVA